MLMKFKKGNWRDVKQQSPLHNGSYDVRLRSASRTASNFVPGHGLALRAILSNGAGSNLKVY